MTSPSLRPLPNPSSLTEPFWQAAAEHRLVAQCCDACGRLRHYPRPMCPDCHAVQYSWQTLSGRGQIYSYCVAHQAFHPFWADRVPYVIATIELEEGIRMLSEMPDLAPESVAIGSPVRVDFEAIEGGLWLPFFRVVSDRSAELGP